MWASRSCTAPNGSGSVPIVQTAHLSEVARNLSGIVALRDSKKRQGPVLMWNLDRSSQNVVLAAEITYRLPSPIGYAVQYSSQAQDR